MLVKCDHHRLRIVLPRIADGLPDDLLGPEMDAIKHADGQADLAAAVAQFVGGVNDVHASRIRGELQKWKHPLFQFQRSHF